MDTGASWVDQVLAAWELGPGTGVDATLIAAQLRLTPEQRLLRMQDAINAAEEAARDARRLPPTPVGPEPAPR